ncbi:MAG: hypothetical protein IT208_16900 [Chthonomonadales bacterium]|nr:hypothetical protein [Chthonomonadales bacterium]
MQRPSPAISHEPPERPAAPAAPAMPAGRAVAAIALGLLLSVVVAEAVRHSELVTGRPVAHGVPPLPAFAVLVLLSALRPALRRLAPRLAPTRQQILVVYAMLTTSTILVGAYHIRALLPHLVSMRYLGRAGGPMADYAAYLPAWLAPRGLRVALDYYEGSPTHGVPWAAWAVPLFWWSLFLAAVFAAAFSLVVLIRRQWIHEERLSFPLLGVPLAVVSGDGGLRGAAGRRALFAAGLAAAATFNGLNILHVLYPPAPAIGFQVSLAPYFTSRPWEPLGDISLFFMLEAIGIGYLVPLQITFSTWFFYLLSRLFAVAGAARGLDDPGFPYTQDVSAGAFVALGVLLAWGLRRTLADSLARAFRREGGASAERWAWLVLGSSTVFLLAFVEAAGFSLWLAAPYFAVIGLFLLVYVRIRAEAGVPFGFIYPYGLPKEMVLNAVSVPGALSLGGTGSVVLFSAFAWMSRHHLAEEHAAYQLDGLKLAEGSRIPMGWMLAALALAFAVGLAAAFWAHLDAYYAIGSNVAGGGGAIANEWRAALAQQEYEQMASRLASPPARNMTRVTAELGGACVAAILSWARLRWVGCPFHPLGFLLATCQGDTSVAWFPLFVAWLCKWLILRAGGLRAYRQGIPFFLGLAIGHYFVAGVFWPVLSLFIAPEASRSYGLFFGG